MRFPGSFRQLKNVTSHLFSFLIVGVLGVVLISVAPLPDWHKVLREELATSAVDLASLYKDLHQNGELSLMEEKTAGRMASELEELGFEVTKNVGGHGVVGIYKNGDGPTIMVRTDLDALPIEEKAAVPYPSKATALNEQGNEVAVMHACGHDMHMTVWVGTARMLLELRDNWKGTLMMIGQPAEEIGQGSYNMLQDGLYDRFEIPDYGLALHMNPEIPAGTVGLVEGFSMASVDAVDIEVFGAGGHGAAPHLTVDPVVLAALMVMEFQTIVSRNINPIESAVVTVGAIQGGTKHNIIPDKVHLQLTIRTYKDEVRAQVLKRLEAIGRGIAISAGLDEDKYPRMTIRENYTPANYNDPDLNMKLSQTMGRAIGESNVLQLQPVMIGEDFSRYGSTKEDVPTVLFWLGSTNPKILSDLNSSGKQIPGLHSPYFMIDVNPAISTGVTAMTSAVIDLMNEGKKAKR